MTKKDKEDLRKEIRGIRVRINKILDILYTKYKHGEIEYKEGLEQESINFTIKIMSKGYYLPDEGKNGEFKELKERVKSEDKDDYTKAWEIRKIIKEMRNKLEYFRNHRKELRKELNPNTVN